MQKLKGAKKKCVINLCVWLFVFSVRISSVLWDLDGIDGKKLVTSVKTDVH